MTPGYILFNIFVGMAFVSSLADHYFVSRRDEGKAVPQFRPNRALLLGCFIYTEGYIALTDKPAVWLFVALNFWGVYCLFIRNKVPLATVWFKRRAKWIQRKDEHDSRDSERNEPGGVA